MSAAMKLFFIACITSCFYLGGVIAACSLPLTGTTWVFNKTIDIVLVDIDSAEVCGNICMNSLNTSLCWGYTWESSQVTSGFCYLFKSLPKSEKDCKDCISGEIPGKLLGFNNVPQICYGNTSNIVGLESSRSEMGCLQHCVNTENCNYYSWMNSDAVFMNACFMFQSCNASQAIEQHSITRDCGIPPLPNQCFLYKTLNSPKRNVHTTYEFLDQYKLYKNYAKNYNYSKDFSSSYNTANDDWEGSQWYKIESPSGTVIPEYPPGRYFCNALYPGWMNSSHPEDAGVTKRVQICFQNETNTCMVSKEALVTNCKKYFVYFLNSVPSGNMKYCTAENYKREIENANGCHNNTDEQDSMNMPTHLKCENQDRCIPEAYKCDGIRDCDDGSDEVGCPSANGCNPITEFRCFSGECTRKEWYCDNAIDCEDGSDEPRGCTKLT